ncbi:hypothetical protein [Nodosilinea sp. P-1105]|uniref:slr1601 family putative cell division protein n=1 Tax=Nodosilinea sp. P-1105 TaxID=2546229 RepID=UPI00146BB79B|nr:hypothetical protein [Nodosilinea sp. P-1105]NMF84788.1 hypothetical protein [Nodosilinea sp. P-1105]
MYAEAPPKPTPRSSTKRQRRQRPQSVWRRLAQHTPLMEVSARLAVNGVLAVVALGALGRLVPYLQTQTQQLQMVNDQVTALESSTTELKADFSRYFDPAQSRRIMQEQTGYKVPTERQVVWTQDQSEIKASYGTSP